MEHYCICNTPQLLKPSPLVFSCFVFCHSCIFARQTFSKRTNLPSIDKSHHLMATTRSLFPSVYYHYADFMGCNLTVYQSPVFGWTLAQHLVLVAYLFSATAGLTLASFVLGLAVLRKLTLPPCLSASLRTGGGGLLVFQFSAFDSPDSSFHFDTC